jgi:hypothetical protein
MSRPLFVSAGNPPLVELLTVEKASLAEYRTHLAIVSDLVRVVMRVTLLPDPPTCRLVTSVTVVLKSVLRITHRNFQGTAGCNLVRRIG